MQNKNNRNKNLEWFQNLAVEEQLNIFQDYSEMLKIVATNLMQEEIERKCGSRYKREKPENGRYSRWGYNPGSVKIGDEKIPDYSFCDYCSDAPPSLGRACCRNFWDTT